MTDKAEWFSNVLKDAQALREVIVDDCIDFPRVVHSMCHKAADLIVQLATELEQVTQECDGLNIMLTSATSAAETYKRERDAAVEDLKLWNCFSCKNAGYSHSEICASCVYNRVRLAKGYVSGRNRYEWRGVKMNLEDKRREN